MLRTDVENVAIGDIINVNSSEGDVKTLYVTSVDVENNTATGVIQCRKYTETVQFDKIINIVEDAGSTDFKSRMTLGLTKAFV